MDEFTLRQVATTQTSIPAFRLFQKALDEGSEIVIPERRGQGQSE
jgi:hypothetical protein